MALRIRLLAYFAVTAGICLAADSGPISPRDLQYDPAAHEIQKAQLPKKLAEELSANSKKCEARVKAAEQDLLAFLKAEKDGDTKTAFYLIDEGVREGFPRNSENMTAIISDIKLYRDPPARPTNLERENMDRVAWLVEKGKLSFEIDDPLLWAFQFVHGTSSLGAEFAITGPYSYAYRLVDYNLIRINPTSDGRVVAWVEETLRMPGAIEVAQLSQYRLNLKEGRWQVWAYRTLDGPFLQSWVGMPTSAWPDDLAYRAGMDWKP